MPFFCCKKTVLCQRFPIRPYGEFEFVTAIFGYCPHCSKSFYKEIRTDFKGNKYTSRTKKDREADKLIKKAYFNRLHFLEFKVSSAKSCQNWYYGDFKKCDNFGRMIKDERGHIIEFQIKRNFNGEEVENLGMRKVVYK